MGNCGSHSEQQVSDSPQTYVAPGQPSPPPAPYTGPQRYTVTIPRNVRPGMSFPVIINGQKMMAKCPPNSKPGEKLLLFEPGSSKQNLPKFGEKVIIFPGSSTQTRAPAPVQGSIVMSQTPTPTNYSVIVPENISVGQQFTVSINNQQVTITCPEGFTPGQTMLVSL